MICLTGGKTGGHIIPLLALAKKIDKVCYIGAKNSLEERLCKKNQITFIAMDLKNNHIIGVLKAMLKLKPPKIDKIISTGGYVSFPVLLYGILHHIPIYLLEENVIMGRTNKIFSLFSKKVFLTYPLEPMKKKYKVVGLPTLTDSLSYQSYKHLSIDILILGGSLGSKPLCDLIYTLKDKYRVCLVAGRYYEDYQSVEGVTIFNYVEDLPNLMLQAKVIISRAGASTTYEIFSIGRPCILIPSMKTSKNHQYLNALYFEQKGCALLLKEAEMENSIKQYIHNILQNPEYRLEMIKAQSRLIQRDTCEIILKELGI